MLYQRFDHICRLKLLITCTTIDDNGDVDRSIGQPQRRVLYQMAALSNSSGRPQLTPRHSGLTMVMRMRLKIAMIIKTVVTPDLNFPSNSSQCSTITHSVPLFYSDLGMRPIDC